MKAVRTALALLLFAYSFLILLRYAAGMHDILTAAGFLQYFFNVAGSKLLFIVLLAAAAYGVGGFTFSRWLPVFDSLLEEALIKTALGLIVVSYAVFVLGLAGLLYPAAGYILLAACLGAGARGITGFARRVSQLPVSIKPTVPGVVLAGLALYMLIGGFYAALMPPTAFDVLMYHYGAPKLYIEAHRIMPTPDVNGSSYPFGTEMLYLLAMLVESDISANMVNYFLCIGSGLVGYAFARRFVGRTSPLLTATMFFCVPVVYWLMPQAYVEFSQGFFICAAVYAIVASFGEKGARWLYVSAALIGMAMCVKYTSNLLLPVMLAGAAYKAYSLDRAGARGAASAVLKYSAIALAIVLPWYVKNL
jgi:hypothetical protein